MASCMCPSVTRADRRHGEGFLIRRPEDIFNVVERRQHREVSGCTDRFTAPPPASDKVEMQASSAKQWWRVPKLSLVEHVVDVGNVETKAISVDINPTRSVISFSKIELLPEWWRAPNLNLAHKRTQLPAPEKQDVITDIFAVNLDHVDACKFSSPLGTLAATAVDKANASVLLQQHQQQDVIVEIPHMRRTAARSPSVSASIIDSEPQVLEELSVGNYDIAGAYRAPLSSSKIELLPEWWRESKLNLAKKTCDRYMANTTPVPEPGAFEHEEAVLFSNVKIFAMGMDLPTERVAERSFEDPDHGLVRRKQDVCELSSHLQDAGDDCAQLDTSLGQNTYKLQEERCALRLTHGGLKDSRLPDDAVVASFSSVSVVNESTLGNTLHNLKYSLVPQPDLRSINIGKRNLEHERRVQMPLGTKTKVALAVKEAMSPSSTIDTSGGSGTFSPAVGPPTPSSVRTPTPAIVRTHVERLHAFSASQRRQELPPALGVDGGLSRRHLLGRLLEWDKDIQDLDHISFFDAPSRARP